MHVAANWTSVHVRLNQALTFHMAAVHSCTAITHTLHMYIQYVHTVRTGYLTARIIIIGSSMEDRSTCNSNDYNWT